MKPHVIIPTDIRKSIDKEVRRQLIENNTEFSKDIDALYLLALHKKYGFGKKRLEEFWSEAVDSISEYMKQYQLGSMEIGYIVRDHLKRSTGVDIEEMYRKHKMRVHK